MGDTFEIKYNTVKVLFLFRLIDAGMFWFNAVYPKLSKLLSFMWSSKKLLCLNFSSSEAMPNTTQLNL